ncbi:unnamed protein product [Lota lota]
MCGLDLFRAGARWSPSLLWVLLASVAAESRFEKTSGSPYGMAGDLAEQVGTYLRQLAQEKAVVSAQKVAAVAGEALAAGLNVCSRSLAQLLAAAGVDDVIPTSQVSAEGVVFVGQWLLLSLIGYWVIWLLVRTLASSLRFGVRLLKVGGALAAFGLILSDRSAAMETTTIRLAVLLLLCVLLGVGPRGGGARDDKSIQLEKQVKTLERRVREMERQME